MPKPFNEKNIQKITNLMKMTLFLFAMGLCGQIHFMFDLLNHFRPLLILFFVTLSFYLFLCQYRPKLWIYLIAAILLNVCTTPNIPDYKSNSTSKIKLMHFNLLVSNLNQVQVIAAIKKHKPNVISLQEATGSWKRALKEGLPSYNFLCHERFLSLSGGKLHRIG